MDFTGIEGSLTDLKLILELEGLVPFNWRNKAKLESFDSKVVNRFLEGLSGENYDLIKVIYYNYDSKTFGIGHFYYREWYWDGKDLENSMETWCREGYKLYAKLIEFALDGPSGDEAYAYVLDPNENINSILEYLKIGIDDIEDWRRGEDNSRWRQFYDLNKILDGQLPPSCNARMTELIPIMYYINMN